PTQSPRYSVWPVVGRIWPSTTRPPRWSTRSGAPENSMRSAKHRSASRPQDAMRRCRWSIWPTVRSVCLRASSVRLAISATVCRVQPAGQPDAGRSERLGLLALLALPDRIDLRLADLPVEEAGRAVQHHHAVDEVEPIDVAPVLAARATGGSVPLELA